MDKPINYNFECCRCGGCFDEESYKYNYEIYCWDCLISLLEERGEVITSNTTTYYSCDSYYGNSDDIEEVIKNITDEFEIERVDCR